MSLLKNTKILDVILSICWFLMDFSWFLDLHILCGIFMGLGLLVSFPLYLKTPANELSSILWFLMNLHWCVYDSTELTLSFYCAIFFFILGITSISHHLYVTIKEHREITNPLKRVK